LNAGGEGREGAAWKKEKLDRAGGERENVRNIQGRSRTFNRSIQRRWKEEECGWCVVSCTRFEDKRAVHDRERFPLIRSREKHPRKGKAVGDKGGYPRFEKRQHITLEK